MNVVKCTNGHFYDGDKYMVCPHCGAGTGGKKAPEPEKKNHFPWNKNKSDDSNITPVPDRTMGKTFGIFADDTSAVGVFEDKPEELSRKTEIPPEPVVLSKTCFVCGKTYDRALASCPYCVQKAPQSAPSEEKPPQSAPAPSESLKEAVKKASSTNQGKTVGFFSMGTASSQTAPQEVSEPVVGWLVCVKGVHFGESFVVVAGRNSVGRGEENKIILSKDGTVSRNKHAWLTYEPKKREFFLQPGEGSGLSYVNGDNVMESRKLREKDLLEFGNGQYLLIPLCNETFSWEDFMNKE